MFLGLEQMDRSILQQLGNLQIIAKYGVGLDNLDVISAEEMGIVLGWTGGVNKRSASEQALGFMLGLSRNLFFSSFTLKNGKWEKEGGSYLTGKTVGIIGCGNISETYFNSQKIFNNYKIIACSDINIELAELSAKKFNVKAQSVDDILLNTTHEYKCSIGNKVF